MSVTSRKLVSPCLRGGHNIDGVWARVCGTRARVCALASVGAARSGRISSSSRASVCSESIERIQPSEQLWSVPAAAEDKRATRQPRLPGARRLAVTRQAMGTGCPLGALAGSGRDCWSPQPRSTKTRFDAVPAKLQQAAMQMASVPHLAVSFTAPRPRRQQALAETRSAHWRRGQLAAT